MQNKLMIFVIAAFSVFTAVAEFNDSEKSAIRKVVSSAMTELKSATVLDGKAITLLPVKGDAGGFCEPLLIGALIKAGKTCVVSNDEKEPRFKRILTEIKWDEMQTTLKSIDPATADALGRLKSTQVLLEARLDIAQRGRKHRAVAELSLLAYEISTKRYLWSADIAVDDAGRVWPNPSDVGIKVEFTGEDEASNIAALIATDIHNKIAGFGYRVNPDTDANAKFEFTVIRETFDASGEYVIFNGTVLAKLSSTLGDGIFYEKTFSVKGTRALGALSAEKNLAAKIATEIKVWMDEILPPRTFFAKHPDFADAIGK